MQNDPHATPRPAGTAVATAAVQLRLLCVTDLHAHVLPFNYFAKKRAEDVGLARTASLIRAAQAEVANSLVLDNGDFLQGTPLADYIAEKAGLRPGSVHPVISAMNAAGIEAATLGNHEFNYGLPFLERALEDAHFPVVSANVLKTNASRERPAAPLRPPYVVLDRIVTDSTGNSRNLKVGIIGFAPPQIVEWDSALLNGQIETQDILESARAYLPKLRAEGADLVVALCHSGFGTPNPAPRAENAALALAAGGGIDVLFAGHAHQSFPSEDFADHAGLDTSAGTAAGVPAVMAGANGSQLGIIDLWLDQTTTGWRVQSSASEIRHIAMRNQQGRPDGQVSCDPTVKAGALDMHRATLAHLDRPIGHLAAPLNSFFAMMAPCPCAGLIAQAQRWFVEQELSETEFGSLPILSAAASFKTGGRSGPDHYTDIAAGPMSWRHAADIYPFPNRLCALKVTGAELKGWLERAAGIFNHIQPGRTDLPLLDPAFAAYNFDQIFGLTYIVDLSQPARFCPDGTLRNSDSNRVFEPSYNGVRIAPEDTFVIVTNDYRANGGGSFPGTGPDRVIYTSPQLNRDILISYIAKQGTVPAIRESAWRFAPVPGASALIETSPAARDHLDRIAHLAPEMLETTERGFQKLRIELP